MIAWLFDCLPKMELPPKITVYKNNKNKNFWFFFFKYFSRDEVWAQSIRCDILCVYMCCLFFSGSSLGWKQEKRVFIRIYLIIRKFYEISHCLFRITHARKSHGHHSCIITLFVHHSNCNNLAKWNYIYFSCN